MGVHAAAFDELDCATLYDLLRLRVDVFVVEQQCPYPELDGRDTEPSTVHLWIGDGHDHVAAYLRLLSEPDGSARIGRVAVARQARGRGHAARLMRAALDRVGGRPCLLNAQSHLVGFYERYGFVATGPESLEDGIPHVAMLRPPRP